MPQTRIVTPFEFNSSSSSITEDPAMLNLTPEKLRENYYIYENKYFDEEKKFAKWALFKGDLSYQMLEEELKTKI